ncbi:MAG: R3H domain-containing nucleic acid-binding protein [Candidatus Obscuribacterales bacterium]|nr:R3H domain-containing nucleic acid-binding protein [Candidatus Obscuribacterales bacterium]
MSQIDEDNARSYLGKILAILDIEAGIVQEDIDEKTTCFRIECKADDARILIGRNGQTLESLQFIVRQMCRGSQSEQGPFIVDVLDYRSRRKRNLEDQAKKGAVAVLNGDTEKYSLLPMTAYERRIVHQYLQDNFADLASESEGMGPDRHIVISYRGMPAGHDDGDDDDSAEYDLADLVDGADKIAKDLKK